MTQEELKSWLTYSPETGKFKWLYQSQKSKQWNGRFAGKIAGSVNSKGYVVIGIEGFYYKAHRLAFIYMGEDVPDYVDHLDQIKSNNAWDNLREATNSQNVAHKGKYNTNTSGYKNVSWAKTKAKWYVKVVKDGKVHGDYYSDLKEAVEAANTLRKELFAEFAYHEEFENARSS